MIFHQLFTACCITLALSSARPDSDFDKRYLYGAEFGQSRNGISFAKGDYSLKGMNHAGSAFDEGQENNKRHAEDEAEKDSKRAVDDGGEDSEDSGEAVVRRQWNQYIYNKADIQRQIDLTRSQRDDCYRVMGWTMPPPPPPPTQMQQVVPIRYGGRMPMWFPFVDKKRTYYDYTSTTMLNDLRTLQAQLTACTQASRFSTTTTDPRIVEYWRLLQEGTRQLQWCITHGGKSSISTDISNIKSYDLTKLQMLYSMCVAEHVKCMAGIGRLPNGDFITKPPTTTTTTRPTTTTTTTPPPTTQTTTTSTTTTTTPTTTTTTATTTTTTLTTTTPGIFTTTVPLTTLC